MREGYEELADVLMHYNDILLCYGISAEELKQWHQKSGLPLKRFFNTSGMRYRELQLKNRLPEMSEEEQYDLLASDGMLVKRPLVIGDHFVLVGFKEKEWEEFL